MKGLELPAGFDDRTVLTLTPSNHIVIAHPDYPPKVLDEQTLQWVDIEPQALAQC